MTQQRTRSTSRPCWISSPSRTFTSGRACHTVTGTGRKQVAKNTKRQINFKRSVERNNTGTFTTDLTVFYGSERLMRELGRSEEVILEMDRLASEDHSHIATEEEIDVYRGNWWIRSNLVDSDRMPTRHRLDFKKALSTLHRFKKAEEKAYYQNWSLSSSSSWCNGKLPGGIPHLRHHRDDGPSTDRSRKPAKTVLGLIIRGMSLTKNLVHNLQ